MKGEFDALARQPVRQAAKASDFIITKTFSASSTYVNYDFEFGFSRNTSTISSKGLVFRLSTDNSL